MVCTLVRKLIITHVKNHRDRFVSMSHKNKRSANAYFTVMYQSGSSLSGRCELVATSKLLKYIFEIHNDMRLYPKFDGYLNIRPFHIIHKLTPNRVNQDHFDSYES